MTHLLEAFLRDSFLQGKSYLWTLLVLTSTFIPITFFSLCVMSSCQFHSEKAGTPLPFLVDSQLHLESHLSCLLLVWDYFLPHRDLELNILFADWLSLSHSSDAWSPFSPFFFQSNIFSQEHWTIPSPSPLVHCLIVKGQKDSSEMHHTLPVRRAEVTVVD